MITMFMWDKQTMMRCATSTSCTGWRARTLWTSGSVFHLALHSGLGKEALCFLTSQMRLLPPYHKPRQLDYQTRICPLFKQTKIHIHLCLLFKQTNKKDTIEISLSIITKEQKHIKEYHISFHHGIPILKQI